MKIDPDSSAALSAQIAEAIRDAILSGEMDVDARLPSEAELSEQFDVSRPTIREALKRLAAQSLIRTQRGAFGGAFVRRLSYGEAQEQLITTSTLLLSMNDVSFDTACEARFALERSCADHAVNRRSGAHLESMAREVAVQETAGLSDEDFCASDVAFHTAIVSAAGNPVLIYQVASAIQAMQPLMNMITFTARSRAEIVLYHKGILEALSAKDTAGLVAGLMELETYTKRLAHSVFEEKRSARATRASHAPAPLKS